MNTHIDYRATRYLDCFDLPQGQINVSIVNPGVICAFHRHKHQTDYWTVLGGCLEVLTVLDGEVSSYVLKDGRVYKGLSSTLGYLEILPQNWHGYRNIGNEEAILLYYVTEKYDPSDPDEERITPEELGVVFEDKIK